MSVVISYKVIQKADLDNLHIPPKTPAILQSHRYHHVMPSSSGVAFVDAAVSSELIVFS